MRIIADGLTSPLREIQYTREADVGAAGNADAGLPADAQAEGCACRGTDRPPSAQSYDQYRNPRVAPFGAVSASFCVKGARTLQTPSRVSWKSAVRKTRVGCCLEGPYLIPPIGVRRTTVAPVYTDGGMEEARA